MCDYPCHDNGRLSKKDLAKIKKLGRMIKKAFRDACDDDEPEES